MRSTVSGNPFAGVANHISHSQVSNFDKCELQWWLKYVKGIQKPPTVYMLLGQCYHKALALNFEQKLLTGVDLPVDDVLERFSSAFDTAVSDGSINGVAGQNFEALKEPVSRLLAHYYHEYVREKMEPVLVEQELSVSVPGVDRQFVGVIDLQLSDGRMIDFKISSRKWQNSEVSENKQATAYAMLYGIDIDFEFHIGLRGNKIPAVQVLKMRRTQQDVDDYIRYLQGIVARMKGLESGDSAPVAYTGFCSEKICQYYQECRDWKYGRGDWAESGVDVAA